MKANLRTYLSNMSNTNVGTNTTTQKGSKNIGGHSGANNQA